MPQKEMNIKPKPKVKYCIELKDASEVTALNQLIEYAWRYMDCADMLFTATDEAVATRVAKLAKEAEADKDESAT